MATMPITQHLRPEYAGFLSSIQNSRIKYVVIGDYAAARYDPHVIPSELVVWMLPAPEAAQAMAIAVGRFSGQRPPFTLFASESQLTRIEIWDCRISITTSLPGSRFTTVYKAAEFAVCSGLRLRFPNKAIWPQVHTHWLAYAGRPVTRQILVPPPKPPQAELQAPTPASETKSDPQPIAPASSPKPREATPIQEVQYNKPIYQDTFGNITFENPLALTPATPSVFHGKGRYNPKPKNKTKGQKQPPLVADTGQSQARQEPTLVTCQDCGSPVRKDHLARHQVKCPMRSQGKNRVAIGQALQVNLRGRVTCPDCGSSVRKDRLAQHQSNKCPKRKLKLALVGHTAGEAGGPGSPQNPKYAEEALRQSVDEERFAGKYLGFMRRESGKFGSLPLYDDHDDEADAE